jgi:hypothetical protein
MYVLYTSLGAPAHATKSLALIGGAMSVEGQEIKRLFTRLKKAKRITFPLLPKHLDVPDEKGVYIIRNPRGTVCHVGCAPRGKRGLYQRLRNHMDTQSSFTIAKTKWHGKKLRGKYKFQFLVVTNSRNRMLLEALAVGTLCPLHIGLHQSKTKKR